MRRQRDLDLRVGFAKVFAPPQIADLHTAQLQQAGEWVIAFLKRNGLQLKRLWALGFREG